MERLRQSNAILRLLNLILFCRNFADSGIFDCNEMFEIRVNWLAEVYYQKYQKIFFLNLNY